MATKLYPIGNGTLYLGSAKQRGEDRFVSQYVAALFGGKVCNVQYDRGQDVGSYQ